MYINNHHITDIYLNFIQISYLLYQMGDVKREMDEMEFEEIIAETDNASTSSEVRVTEVR